MICNWYTTSPTDLGYYGPPNAAANSHFGAEDIELSRERTPTQYGERSDLDTSGGLNFDVMTWYINYTPRPRTESSSFVVIAFVLVIACICVRCRSGLWKPPELQVFAFCARAGTPWDEDLPWDEDQLCRRSLLLSCISFSQYFWISVDFRFSAPRH